MTIHNTAPKKGYSNWQFDILPCIGILRVDYTKDEDYQNDVREGLYDKIADYEIETKYYSITFQWLFWNLNWQINK